MTLPPFPADPATPTLVVPGRGYARGKLQRFKRSSYSAIVVHTTGLGVHKKATRWGVTPFEATQRVFARQIDTSGHYIIGQGPDELAQVVPEEIPAWHVGGKGSRKYNRARWWEQKSVAWWRQRWPQFYTPRDLGGGALWGTPGGRMSCNANTIGIEVIPPVGNGPWSDDCWRTLGRLCLDISGRRGLALSLETVVTHSDAHPFSRSAKGKPWDPAPVQWSFERFAEVAGLPLISGVGQP